ncbi:hypothetical protein FB451DRAFT_1172297 [Mycena latifolia]|nr:hypothetical protein FB451DRAFT_1172297 [Mycena latifolia]
MDCKAFVLAAMVQCTEREINDYKRWIGLDRLPENTAFNRSNALEWIVPDKFNDYLMHKSHITAQNAPKLDSDVIEISNDEPTPSPLHLVVPEITDTKPILRVMLCFASDDALASTTTRTPSGSFSDMSHTTGVRASILVANNIKPCMLAETFGVQIRTNCAINKVTILTSSRLVISIRGSMTLHKIAPHGMLLATRLSVVSAILKALRAVLGASGVRRDGGMSSRIFASDVNRERELRSGPSVALVVGRGLRMWRKKLFRDLKTFMTVK